MLSFCWAKKFVMFLIIKDFRPISIMWYNFQTPKTTIMNIFYTYSVNSLSTPHNVVPHLHCQYCSSSYLFCYNSFNIIIILPSRKCLCRFSKAGCMQKVAGKWFALCKFFVIWSICTNSQTRFPLWGSGSFISELWQKGSDPSGSRGNAKGTRP